MGEQPTDQDPQGERPPPDASERERRDSIRQYILGELSEEGLEQVERQLISRDDYFEELLIVEEELTDDFISERLTDPARVKFRRRFLAVPELRQDVRFAMALRRRAAEETMRAATRPAGERSPPFLTRFSSFFQRQAVGFALAASLFVAVCTLAWMATQNSRLRTQVEQLRARQTPEPTSDAELLAQLAAERERGDQLAARLSREQEQRAEAERKATEAMREQARPVRTQTPGPAVAAVFTLTSGIVRGEGDGLTKIPLRPGAGRLLVRLDLAADEYRSYRATLKALGEKEVLSTSNLRAGRGGKSVLFPLPVADLAPNNDYQIVLSGRAPNGKYENVGTYSFRTIR